MLVKSFVFEENSNYSQNVQDLTFQQRDSHNPPSLTLSFRLDSKRVEDMAAWLQACNQAAFSKEDFSLNAVMEVAAATPSLIFRGDITSTLAFLKHHAVIDERHLYAVYADPVVRKAIEQSVVWYVATEGDLLIRQDTVSQLLASQTIGNRLWSEPRGLNLLKTVKKLDVESLEILRHFIDNEIFEHELLKAVTPSKRLA